MAIETPGGVSIADAEFEQLRTLIHRIAGIHLTDVKRSLLTGRLQKRLGVHGLKSYGEYYRLISSPTGAAERQVMVDLLTTNETFFFREPQHFRFLVDKVFPDVAHPERLKLWSAACSSGEEVYTLAMVLADTFGMTPDWRILGTDISSRVVATAVRGQYPLATCRGLGKPFLKRFCLKGTGEHDGTFKIDGRLRRHTEFRQLNLNEALPELGTFDVVFLRNVLIYFQTETKRAIVDRVLSTLRPGGYFFVGLSESLNWTYSGLTHVAPSVYRKNDA